MISIINSVVLFFIIIFKLTFFIKERIDFRWDTTFWEKKKFGFHITLWNIKKSEMSLYGGASGKIIFRFIWRDSSKLSDNINKAKKSKKA